MTKTIEERALEMTGDTADLQAAFDQWENERAALSEFHDLIQAMQVHNKVFADAAGAAHLICEMIQNTKGVLIPERLQKRIAKFMEQYERLPNRVVEAGRLRKEAKQLQLPKMGRVDV